MDLQAARSRVRFFINEPSAAQWTDAKLDELIVSANREVYSDICARTVDYFHKEVRVTYPASTVSIVLDTATDEAAAPATVGRWVRLLAIFELDTQAVPSSTNIPTLMPVAEHVTDLYQSSVVGPNEDPWNQVITSDKQWKLYGRNLFLYPFDDATVNLWVHLIPQVFDPTANAHELLSIDAGTTGELSEYHDIIPMLAAIDILMNVGEESSDLRTRYARKFQSLIETLGLQQQSQSPSRVTDLHVR